MTTFLAPSANARKHKTSYRVGKFIGGMFSNGVLFYAGYMWAKHGWLRALEVEGGFLLVVFAFYGMAHFPWKGDAA